MKVKSTSTYIALFAVGILGILYLQYRLVDAAISSKSEELELQLSHASDQLKRSIEESYYCFQLTTDVTIPPGQGMRIVTGNDTGQRLREFVFLDSSVRSAYPVYPNPEFIYREPIAAQVQLNFSFLGTQDAHGLDVDSATMAWVDEAYEHVLRDPETGFRFIDTAILQSQVEEHYASLIDLGKTIVSIRKVGGNALYEWHGASFDPMANHQQEAIVLYDRPPFEEAYVLSVEYPSPSVFASLDLQLIVIGLIAVTLITGLFLWQFLKAQYRKQKLVELRNEFVNNMTHEFKTPVTNIQLALDTLRRRMNGHGDNDDLVTIIQKENSRINEQINRILHAASGHANLRLKKQVMDPEELILEILESDQLKLGQEVQVDVSLSAGKDIECDRHLLETVLRDIIDNALKYNDKKEVKLRIKTGVVSGRYRISIADNGKGMTDFELSQAFDRFFRASQGRRHDVKGFGLGLYNAREVIRAHDGAIRMESKSGKGTTVHIELPIIQKHERIEATSTTS